MNSLAYSVNSQNSVDDLEIMRHSAAHVLAMAISELYPEARLGIGPATSDGFYYDVEVKIQLTKEDLPVIEEKMREIKKMELPFIQKIVSKEEAMNMLNMAGQLYKVELLSELDDSKVSFYQTGDKFIDLCRGPHVEHTGQIGEFKLIDVSGAYWKGNEDRPQLQRITGIAFKSEDEIEQYFKKKEEIQETDHRMLARDLEIFANDIDDLSGFPTYLPKGSFILKKVKESVFTSLLEEGYMFVQTPVFVADNEGYYKEKYGGLIYGLDSDDGNYILRPTALKQHLAIAKKLTRSYKDIPLKLTEDVQVFRNEKSGEIVGLHTTREISVNESLVVDSGELTVSIKEMLDIIKKFFTLYGFKDYYIRLIYNEVEGEIGIRQEKIVGIIKDLFKSSKINYLELRNEKYSVNPKIEFVVRDEFGREVTLSSIQPIIDLPEEEEISYIDDSNNKIIASPIRFIPIGSYERFLVAFLQSTKGNLPFWISPIQVVIIPISDRFNYFATEVSEYLLNASYRVAVDKRSDKMQSKIRDAQLQKIPYMIIIGEKEATMKTVSLRNREGIDLGMMTLEELNKKFEKEI